MSKVSKGTIIRTVLLVMALVNQILAMAGYSALPFEDETISELIGTLFVMITAAMAWWKNNSFTDAAIRADEKLKEYKSGE